MLGARAIDDLPAPSTSTAFVADGADVDSEHQGGHAGYGLDAVDVEQRADASELSPHVAGNGVDVIRGVGLKERFWRRVEPGEHVRPGPRRLLGERLVPPRRRSARTTAEQMHPVAPVRVGQPREGESPGAATW